MLFSQFILGFKGVFLWAKTGLSQNDVLGFLNWKFKTERIERNRISYTAVDGFSEMLAYLISNFKIQQIIKGIYFTKLQAKVGKI